MPASFVHEVGGNSHSGTNNVLEMPTNLATSEGNLLVVIAVCNSATSNPCTFTDTMGNTWTKTIEQARATTGPQLSVGWCIVGAGQSHTPGVDIFTLTWFSGVSVRTGIVVEFAAIDSSPLDRSDSRTGASITPSTLATPNTVQADELLVGCFGAFFFTGNPTWTVGVDYTLASSRTVQRGAEAMVEYRTVNAIDAYSAGAALSATANGWVAAILTFKGIAVGAPTGHQLTATGVGL